MSLARRTTLLDLARRFIAAGSVLLVLALTASKIAATAMIEHSTC